MQKKATVLAAQVVTVTRVNSVYENDFAITLVLIPNNTDIINIISDAAFTAKAERVDTGYNVTWLLTNSFHELKDVRVEGDLYGNFTWDESSVAVPAGKITFDPKTKKLTWTIPKLVTSVDTAALKFPLNFAKINPTQKDLSGPITLTAIDAETGGTISLSVPAIKAQ